MAIWAGKVTVASVGVSCQANHQIDYHGELIRDLVGAKKFKHGRTPFDWIVCPAQSAARMIRDWRFNPADPAELVEDETPHWPDPPCWYWHEGDHLTAGEFLSRQDHFVENFERLRAFERQVFILSNTQRNLEKFRGMVRGPLDFILTDEDVDAVEAAVKAQFPNPELWVIAAKGRHRLQRHRENPRVIEFELDRSAWRGDYDQWAAAFARMLAPAG